MTRIDSLEVQIRSLEGVVERYARSLADIESRQRIDGRAEYATDELDRRVRDLERRINDFDRSISRLESDIRDLNRRIDRSR
jgi:predicted RNase H-like nuclease (RuvC/YqgF family)